MASTSDRPAGAAPLLSLCMIVRDGGAAFARALASARPVVDEIVVVDTGSKDDSRAVARAAGATVVERPWDDDFAAARNAGLAVARGAWILALDADEELVVPDPAAFRRMLETSPRIAYFTTVVSDLGRDDALESAILRLWRHRPDVRFRFPIHEQVLPDLERVAGGDRRAFARIDDVQIRHAGYTPQAIAQHGKVERNVRIFKKAVAAYPDEPYLWFKFADFLRGHAQQQAEALAVAERADALLAAQPPERRRRVPYFAELQAVLAAARLDLGRQAELTAQLEREPPDALAAPAYHYVAALAFESAGAVEQALHHVDACCQARRAAENTAWRPGLVGPQGEALRARLLLRKGDAQAALAATGRALAARPGFLAAVQLRVEALVRVGRPGEAMQLLTAELRRRDEPRLWQQLALLLAAVGRPQEAERCRARGAAQLVAPLAE